MRNYKDFNGYRLASDGDAIWYYPDRPFTYGRLHLLEVAYDTKQTPGARPGVNN